jgi:alpha-D-ribose 1-methylphosphonate 5-triphosphate synthase subunit PhnH
MNAVTLDPAFVSQAAFRAAMDCFARPGDIRTLSAAAPSPLAPASAALIACLADYETPVWLDDTLAGAPAVAEWIRFQTGAPICAEPGVCAFALIGDSAAMPAFTDFAQGSEEYPDRSATVIVQVDRFAGDGFDLQGPGIKGTRHISAEPLPVDFAARLRANRDLFPRGIDLILVAADKVLALPRSVRLAEDV